MGAIGALGPKLALAPGAKGPAIVATVTVGLLLAASVIVSVTTILLRTLSPVFWTEPETVYEAPRVTLAGPQVFVTVTPGWVTMTVSVSVQLVTQPALSVTLAV